MQKVRLFRLFSFNPTNSLCRNSSNEAVVFAEKSKETLTTDYTLDKLKTKVSLNTKRPYKPPANVQEILKDIITAEVGSKKDWLNIKLDDRKTKFNILTSAIEKLNHDIPSCIVSQDIHTTKDLIDYFETEVRETSSYEDLHAKPQDQLPPNLHVQLEALRFNPENDSFFNGKTAFPGRDTIVTSIKYKRKYKGTVGTEIKPGYYSHYKKY